MAAAADWKKELDEAGLPTKVQETLLKMGYITKVSFETLDALEPFLKKLLLEDKVAGDVKPEFWEWHPVSGVLRGLWEADAKAAGVQQVVVNPSTTTQAGLLSLVGGPKLEAGQLRDLWKQFATNYPSEWLDEHTRPCRPCSMCGNSNGKKTSASSHGSICLASPNGKDPRKPLKRRRSPCLGFSRASRAHGSGGSCGIAVAFRCAANIVLACSGLACVGMVPSWSC